MAKITAELAPVNACAAASRHTLLRARASSLASSAAVTSIIGSPASKPRREPPIERTMESGSRPINRRKRTYAMQEAHTGSLALTE
ncbi:hypothetical protein BE61_02990 [Bradyrhizobium elkanii USDA 61]|nr:hypothetical protein BE61_02990 [Bradyrhizobium elkanii USDA 61]